VTKIPFYNFSMRPVMMLFARAPVEGKVKTRLAGAIGAAAATSLHRAMVADTLAILHTFHEECDLELHTDAPAADWPEVAARGVQAAGDLGRRLLIALTTALDQGRPRAMAIGSDSPTLPRARIERLLRSPADLAFGPCEDGGFYAISARRVHPEMFGGVEWSSRRTLELCERAAARQGLTAERGELWYDVDEPADLERLRADPGLGAMTRVWAKENP
jgi:uncharacterized protein